ncbi:hypothetical protein D3C87_1485070 [compost metagenome]
MPVQADMISATICPSTQAGTSGCSPCSARSSSIRPARRCCSGVRAGFAALRREVVDAGAGAAASASAADASCPCASSSARSAWIRSTRLVSATWRASASAKVFSTVAISASSSVKRACGAPVAASRRSAACSVRKRVRRWRASSISAGVALRPSATLAQAVSNTLTALSGNCRPVIYRWDKRAAALMASSRMRTPKCRSISGAMPRSMEAASASSGSSTLTT